MNPHDEGRVIEALRALTGGLTVTDQDIVEARSRLKTGLEPTTSRRRRLTLALAAAAVLVAGFVSVRAITREESAPEPTPASPVEELTAALQVSAYGLPEEEFLAGGAPRPDDLVGLWHLRPPYGPLTMVLRSSGSWQMGSSLSGDRGPYRIEGRLLTRRFGAGNCPDLQGYGNASPWQSAIAADRSLRLQFAGQRNTCSPADDREVWDRLGPGPSPLSQFLAKATAGLEWAPASAAEFPPGMYFAPTGGQVLEVERDSTYRYYDSRLLLADQGRLTVSEDASGLRIGATCRGGGFEATAQAGSTPEVTYIIPARDAVLIEPTSGGCASGLGSATAWVLLTGL